LFLEANAAGGAMPATIVMMANNVYKPGDSFSGSVCAGSYDIVLSDGQPFGEWKDAPPHKVVIASLHVDVVASDIDGLELSPLAMATISGEVPGMTHNVSCPGGGPRVRVSIFRAGDGQSQTVQLDDKNRFSFHNVAPGEYTIYIGPLAREKFYLDSILVDGNPIDGRKFTVAQARPVNIVVNISADVAHAAGHLSPDVRREPRWEVAWTRPKASVAGKVPSASEPDVTVKLRAIRYNSNASAEYVAHLNADGSFLFDSVDPGVYTLRAEGQGRVAVEYGAREAGERGTPIVLARGAHLQGLTLSSPLLSAICGRVSDSQGAAQAGKRIWLQWNQGGIVFGGSTGTEAVMTDADGRFRVNGVAPGEYFISSPLNVNRVVFFSPDGSLRADTPIRVEAGKDVGCSSNAALDLRVPPNYKKEYAFSGKIAGDLPAAIGDRFLVVLADVRASGARSFVGTSKVDAEHRFSFDRIPGGRFLLELHSAYGPEPVTWSGPYGPVSHLLAAQTIDVNDELKEVNITPMQLPTVTGTVHFSHVPEEWKNNFAVANQTITLRPAVYSAPFSSKLAADGTFSIGPEDVGDYEVDLNLRGPLYLKSVRLGGREVQGRYLHFAAGASPKLEIEVSDDSAQVHAQVVPEAALPAAEPSVEETCSPGARPSYHVVLFPDPLFVRQDVQPEPGSASVVQPRLYHGMQDGDDPSFQLVQGAPPGHYRVLALQGPGVLGYTPGSRAAPTDLEQSLWSALAALGEPITLEAGGNVKLMLLDKTVDADRLAAKLGIPLEHSLLTW
jgi:hypothetical protein